MDTSGADIKLFRPLAVTAGLILVLLPFHALFTTWLGSNFGHLDLFRIWKELLLIPLSILAVILVLRTKARRAIFGNRIIRLMIIYVVFNLILGAFAYKDHHVTSNALIYGLLSNTRFIVFYGVCYAITTYNTWLKRHWQALLLIPAAAITIFGLLQHFVLPADFLKHFGYGNNTIPAFQAVDLKSGYIRVQSTLRGPNPLGAYLVVIISALAALFFKDAKRRYLWLIFGALSCVVLFFSYSRSALIASLLSIGIIVWLNLDNQWRKRAVAVAVSLVIIFGGLLTALRGNDRFQNIVFHTDEHSRSADSSNFDRAAGLKAGMHDVINQPLGEGPGTAGPASTRNTGHPTRIAENYFIQLGQELGIVGLAMFLAINIYVGLELLKKRADTLAIVLLASLVGLTFVNLLSHAWADDTLGMLWWGMAGAMLAPSAILKANTLTAQSVRLGKVKNKQ